MDHRQIDALDALRAAHSLGTTPPRTMLTELADRWARKALAGPDVLHVGVFWTATTTGERWPAAAYMLTLEGVSRLLLAWVTVGGVWKTRTLKPESAWPSERAALPREVQARR